MNASKITSNLLFAAALLSTLAGTASSVSAQDVSSVMGRGAFVPHSGAVTQISSGFWRGLSVERVSGRQPTELWTYQAETHALPVRAGALDVSKVLGRGGPVTRDAALATASIGSPIHAGHTAPRTSGIARVDANR